MNKFSQPFYVPIGKGKINLHTGQRGGYYLPPLEPKIEEAVTYQDTKWTYRQWDKVQELESRILYLQKKILNSSEEKKARRGRY
mgnify:CR=1 FL=1